MRRSTDSAQQEDRKGLDTVAPSLRQGASTDASLVDAWWAAVLAGDVLNPHPVNREVKARLQGRRLRLSGELESKEERDELLRQARQRIGHGIDRVDVSSLKVTRRHEKPGLLEQTLISAFPGRVAAEYAQDFVLKHSRVEPKQTDIVDADQADKLSALLPEDFARDLGDALDSGHALLIFRVDETEAFKVRELLDEDTRSEWTVATPPRRIEERP
jgi:hypothetical protein